MTHRVTLLTGSLFDFSDRLGLSDCLSSALHVVLREVTESGVLGSWQVLVVRSLPALVAGLGNDLLQVVFDDQAARMILLSGLEVHLGCHCELRAFFLIIITLTGD